jgi:hypothetical protein
MRKLLGTNTAHCLLSVSAAIALMIAGCYRTQTATLSSIEHRPAQERDRSTTGVAKAALLIPNASLRDVGSTACSLLRSSDFQRVQGEQLRDTKLTDRVEGGLHVAQCFYSLATASKSVALTLMKRDGSPAGRDPREFWNETFHGEKRRNAEKESDEEHEAAAESIKGIGDEAFWSGNRFGGALYILKGNTLVRLSIGGPDNEETRIRKSKALAQIALRHV